MSGDWKRVLYKPGAIEVTSCSIIQPSSIWVHRTTSPGCPVEIMDAFPKDLQPCSELASRATQLSFLGSSAWPCMRERVDPTHACSSAIHSRETTVRSVWPSAGGASIFVAMLLLLFMAWSSPELICTSAQTCHHMKASVMSHLTPFPCDDPVAICVEMLHHVD